MTATLSRAPVAPVLPAVDPKRRVDWRRLRRPAAVAALVASAIGALGQTLGAVVAGRLAEDPTAVLVGVLALCVVGAALLDTVGRVVWAGVSDRAEGRLRADLLDAALHQPLATLSEQAVGEILDRIDDDTHAIGTMVRFQLWQVGRTAFSSVPMWLVAGLTWWPAFVLFPVVLVGTVWVIRPLLAAISERKVVEEIAWTDHAAALEEGIAGRDDLRTSLGQSYVVRRVAQLSAQVHAKFLRVLDVEARLFRRSGLALHALLAGVGVAGVALATTSDFSVASLVTLFIVTTTFVGQVLQLAHHLPELQEGVGALVRLRQMFTVDPEPVGGRPVPASPDVEFRDVHFAYDEGAFALEAIDLQVPAGQTIALVGRTGSGKTTLASLLSRAVEPARGMVFLGGVDVRDLDLQELRAAVGVVGQHTDIVAGTVAENLTLFGDQPRAVVEAAIAELGLTDWVAGLPQGLDTLLGPGGTTLSAGEEQLVAFARLLVRDVRVVVLDEATARMDPVTERRVVHAAERLLTGRTGILIAHRLTTTERADLVAVLDHGRVVQQGARSRLATEPGPFRDLLDASAQEERVPDDPEPDGVAAVGHRRRTGPPPVVPDVGTGPSLTRGIVHALTIRPWWGIGGAIGFLVASVMGAQGAVTGWIWGLVVVALRDGESPTLLTVALVVSLLAAPVVLADAIWRYPRWWIEVMLRARMAVLHGQTQQHRLSKTPPGEVVARSMDADRYARYADRWVDFLNGLVIAAVTALIGGTWLAGAVLLAVMVASAVASSVGRPIAGRSAAASSAARARFGRALVSSLESARTVKLAGATPQVHAHLRAVDSGRVNAAAREHRVQAILDGVPTIMVQCGVVTAWAALLWGWWGLATALLVANAVSGFDWFGRVAGSVVTEAPGTRAWQQATSRLAGGVDLMDLPPGVDLVTGAAPEPTTPAREPLQRLELRDLSAVHDDGVVGVRGVDLSVEAGELVLLVGQVGSGKSSLLGALAGLIDHTGSLTWNGREVDDVQTFLRPGQVAHVAQVPRVLSGTFADNVRLDHDRPVLRPLSDARLTEDIAEAGGVDGLVGHRGVRLSGGQVQRLALARALAAETELVLADDVSSALDATTEIELWAALRERRTTVIGATAKAAALAQADRVVVLVDGEIVAVGPWGELAPQWSHLAG